MDYRQSGALTLIGNTFQPGDPRRHSGVVHVDAPSGAPAAFTNTGNLYTNGITLSVAGNAFGLVSNDTGSTVGSFMPATGVARYRNTEVRLDGPSMVRFDGGIRFVDLGTPTNGAFTYCSDCAPSPICKGGGQGAFARREQGAWKCR